MMDPKTTANKPAKKASNSSYDSFKGRLVIGPLFLVIFDIILVAFAVLSFLFKKKKDPKYILEEMPEVPKAPPKEKPPKPSKEDQKKKKDEEKKKSEEEKKKKEEQKKKGEDPKKKEDPKKVQKVEEDEEPDLGGILEHEGGSSEGSDYDEEAKKVQQRPPAEVEDAGE